MTPVEKLQMIVAMAGDRRLSRAALAVGACMANYYRPDWGYACPSNRLLAKSAGVSKTGALNAIEQLLQVGWFVLLRPGTGTAPARYGIGKGGHPEVTATETSGHSEVTTCGHSEVTADEASGHSEVTTFRKPLGGTERKLKVRPKGGGGGTRRPTLMATGGARRLASLKTDPL